MTERQKLSNGLFKSRREELKVLIKQLNKLLKKEKEESDNLLPSELSKNDIETLVRNEFLTIKTDNGMLEIIISGNTLEHMGYAYYPTCVSSYTQEDIEEMELNND